MIYNVITGKFEGQLMDHPNVRLTKSNSKKMFRCAVQGSSWYTSKKLIIQSGPRDYHIEFREFEHLQLVCELTVRLKNKQKLRTKNSRRAEEKGKERAARARRQMENEGEGEGEGEREGWGGGEGGGEAEKGGA